VIEAGARYLKNLAPAFIPFAVSQVFILTLRSIEQVRLPMITTVIALSVNVVMNYLLIFGFGPIPAMDVAGAARATVMARLVEVIILVWVSYARKYHLAGSPRELLGFRLPFITRFFRIAFPVILNEIIWSTGISLQTVIFARTHTDAIAAFNITSTLSQLTWVLFIGLGNGVGVLIGKKIGEGAYASARDYAGRIIRFAPLLSLGAALLLFPLAKLLPYFFKVNDNVLSQTALMFFILGCSYPFRAFNMSMVVGICRAGGDTVFCAIYDNIFLWTAAIPAAALASFVFNAPAGIIYLCIVIEDPLKMILGLWRCKTGKWLHNVTEGM
jgi:putative MATE family efflux protein